jgi:prefoldin subunit 5
MTTSSTAAATAQQLRLVHDVLQDPLTDKHVMVPLTRKAFFSGKLAPEVDSNGKEQVLLKLSKEHYVTLERREAANVLERRMESFAASTKTAKKKSLALADERASAKVEATEDTTSALAFFEIREELDSEGKEVKSEAVNVVQELEYLQKREDEALNSVTRIPASIVVGGNGTHVTDDFEPNPRISEDAFDKLSSRLDELARLEEESVVNKKENQRSANQLQGSGWSKGFLNANPAKKKSTPGKVPTKPVQHHITSSDDLATKTATSNKKVGFRAENEIHEIPRIGERSASFFKKPEVQEAEPMAGSRPVGADVFSGVIQERSVDKRPVGEKEPSERRSKPLSKFAQERLDLRR